MEVVFFNLIIFCIVLLECALTIRLSAQLGVKQTPTLISFHFLFHYQTLKCFRQYVQNFPSLAESQFMGKFVYCPPIATLFPLLFTELKKIFSFRALVPLWKNLCHLLVHMKDLQLKDLKTYMREDMILMVQKQAMTHLSSK
jgi:hypothetical protein